MHLKRFWYPATNASIMGVGVTAYSRSEAEVLAAHVATEMRYTLAPDPIEDVDVRTLDQNHVVVNMGVSSQRGVWFPLGFDHLTASKL
jgi:hypothetical protein